jgi:hypothetical protein
MQQQGFPPPLGIEQYLGQPQQYGGQPQQYGMQPQFPGQQQLPVQQIVTSLVSQLLPIAQQVILPQVVAAATQQIPWHLQQLVAQQLAWQQPQFGQWGQNPFGRPYQGSF